jgi:hypothetical protein
MTDIVGIVCVYGVTVSLIELLAVLDLDMSQQYDSSELKEYLPSWLSVFTSPDWDDMIILGVPVVQLDLDPSLIGSKMAPVITIPDVTDFTPYTEERPMYYQVPIYD